MTGNKALFYVLSLLIIIILGAFVLNTGSYGNEIKELKQQGLAAYDWLSCKITWGQPLHTPTTENYYTITCKE